MTSIKTACRLAATLLAASSSLTLASALTADAAPATVSHQFYCNDGLFGYYNCSSDNYAIAPGKTVSLAENSASPNYGEYFKVYNKAGEHLLAAPSRDFKPNGIYIAVWTNNTSSTITIDITSEPDGSTAVDYTNHMKY